MEGPDILDPDLQGVIPRMVWSVFDGIYNAPEHIEFLVKISIVELYQVLNISTYSTLINREAALESVTRFVERDYFRRCCWRRR